MGTYLSLALILGPMGPFPEINRSQVISPLLALPRELCDEIINYVLQSPMPPPQPPPFAFRHHQKESDSDVHRGSHKEPIITQQPHDVPQEFTHSAIGLLLTCHQLRAETLQRMETGFNTSNVLDVMVVGTASIKFTWLYISPRVSDKNGLIDSLDIHLRFFRVDNGYSKNEKEKWDNLMNRLWEMITTFLHDGAHPVDHSDPPYLCAKTCGKYGIKNLRFTLYHETGFDWGRKENPFWPGQAYAGIVRKLKCDYPSCKIDKIEVYDDGNRTSFNYLEDMESYWGSLSNYNKVYLSRKRLGMRIAPSK